MRIEIIGSSFSIYNIIYIYSPPKLEYSQLTEKTLNKGTTNISQEFLSILFEETNLSEWKKIIFEKIKFLNFRNGQETHGN
jgi:hypothetical protein